MTRTPAIAEPISLISLDFSQTCVFLENEEKKRLDIDSHKYPERLASQAWAECNSYSSLSLQN